ncbi:MAG: hypothetical protein ACYDHZ_05410 [Dehalococcoidia bacterium]
MGKKPLPLWLQFIQDTIGIPEFIAFIVGAPTVVAVIATIWNALSLQQQIIVAICGILIIGALGLFIYGHTRKVLYKIPSLLYQMQCRCEELSCKLKCNVRVHLKALTLVDKLPDKVKVTINALLAASDEEITNPTTYPAAFDQLHLTKKDLGDLDKITLDSISSKRIVTFYEKVLGIDELLKQDWQYRTLDRKLDKLKIIAPTEEITVAINNYLSAMKACACFQSIVVNAVNTKQMWSLKTFVDLSITTSSLEDERSKSFTKVREAIGKYYKGN